VHIYTNYSLLLTWALANFTWAQAQCHGKMGPPKMGTPGPRNVGTWAPISGNMHEDPHLTDINTGG